MPTTRAVPPRNAIDGRREIDGFTIKFSAIFLDTCRMFEIRVTDHEGEQTSDFAKNEEAFATIERLVNEAIEECRSRAKERAEVE